jgi:signal transduction histidine kinase
MAEVQGRWSRLGFVAALTLIAFVQLDQFARTLRWHSRLRAQYVRTVEGALSARLPEIVAALKYGGPTAWPGALGLVRDVLPEAEVELFDGKGNRLAAAPRPAPVEHAPDAGQRAALAGGRTLTVGPVGKDEARLLTYLALRDGNWDVLLRIAQPVPELVQQADERRELMMGHGLALLALAAAALLALLPGRAGRAPGPAGALDAYAEAMNRLGEMGRAQSRQHVAERRQLEERIRVAEPMARAGELTSGIVHEVRNALGTIVGYARLIEQSRPAAEAAEAAAHIREECETLETFVRRFIEFVKAESLSLGPVDVRRLLSRVAARESASRMGAEVSLGHGPEMTLRGDEELLERAFENLVRNARDAAGEGGHVVLQARRQGEEAALTVADDGPGLSPQELAALGPFRTTKAGGLGLGLPLAVKIVKLHGGVMTMEPGSPRGLLVTVRLPCGGPGTSSEGPGFEGFTA